MHFFFLFGCLGVLISSVFSVSAQQSPGSVSSTSPIYLRIANLMPIDSGPISVTRAQDPFLVGVKPGFIMAYAPVDVKGGKKFGVSLPGGARKDFSIEGFPAPGFYTAVICAGKGGAEVTCARDDPPPPQKEQSAEALPPSPPLRFRGYFGGFDFPYRVTVGKLGTWLVDANSVILDLSVIEAPPIEIQVDYISKEGDSVSIFFPIDYSAAEKYSAFVSQRGKKRPRVRAFSDNTPPAQESVVSDEDAKPRVEPE